MNKTHIYTNYTGIRSQFRLLLLLMAGVFASCTQDGAGVATPLEISAEIGNPQTRADDPHLSDYDKKKFVTDDVIKISNQDQQTSIINGRQPEIGPRLCPLLR